MSKMDLVKSGIKSLPRTVGNWFLAHEGTILPVASSAMSGVAIIFAVRNSRFIMDTIDEGKKALEVTPDAASRKQIYMQVLKAIAPKIAPIAGFYAGSVAVLVLYKKNNDKKIADLTAALTLSQNALVQYQLWKKEAEKSLGAEEAKKVREEVAKENVKNNPQTDENTVAPEGQNEKDAPYYNEVYLYYDVVGNRYFYSEKSPDEIENYCRELSYALCDGNVDGDKVTYNDIYDFIGGPKLEVSTGTAFGWLADMARGKRRSDIIGVQIDPAEKNDHKTLCWQLDMLGGPLFRTRY